MRDKKRIKRILKLLEQLWTNGREDWRFGQLLINLSIVDDTMRVWSNEDSDLEEYLKEYIKQVDKK